MKKKNKNNNIGLKIGGVVIVLVLLIKWGNTFFQAKDTFTPQPKQQSQSTPKQQSQSTPKQESQSTPRIINLSCVFQEAYEDGRKLDSSFEGFASISKDIDFYLDYEYKKMGSFGGWTTTEWNENQITAEFNRDLEGFFVNNTFTLNRNSGKLRREISMKYGSTYINYKCSESSKKF